MRLKKLGAALFVVVALGAIIASSAFAAATTTAKPWVVNGSVLSGSKTAEAEIVSGTKAQFATTVSGTAVELEATGIGCSGCSLVNTSGSAMGSGELVFSGVTVAKPAGCSVASTITTKPLTVEADYESGSIVYVKFEPTAGAEKGFATVELTGASCPIGTAIVPKGTVFVQAANTTGTYAASQKVTSSAAINTTAGGTLHVGTEAASLTGSALFKLSSGEAFGVE